LETDTMTTPTTLETIVTSEFVDALTRAYDGKDLPDFGPVAELHARYTSAAENARLSRLAWQQELEDAAAARPSFAAAREALQVAERAREDTFKNLVGAMFTATAAGSEQEARS
jgi:hypothetical protein